jgi:hypothetical protein
MRKLIPVLLALCLTAASCNIPVGSGNEPVLAEATFARGIENDRPVDPGNEFAQDETIYLYLKFEGRPKKGEIKSEFWFRDQKIADKTVDLADVNSGVIFSIGEFTYAYFTLSFDSPPIVGEGYRAEVSIDGEKLGTYHFKIKPPSDAIQSVIREVVLAKGADENYTPIEPSDTFAPGDKVFIVGRGDYGIGTWLQAEWYVNGDLIESATRSLTLKENTRDTGFSFSYLPDGGWPAGEHYVVLIMNGSEIDRYNFKIE